MTFVGVYDDVLYMYSTNMSAHIVKSQQLNGIFLRTKISSALSCRLHIYKWYNGNICYSSLYSCPTEDSWSESGTKRALTEPSRNQFPPLPPSWLYLNTGNDWFLVDLPLALWWTKSSGKQSQPLRAAEWFPEVFLKMCTLILWFSFINRFQQYPDKILNFFHIMGAAHGKLSQPNFSPISGSKLKDFA